MDDFMKDLLAQIELDGKIQQFKNTHGLIIKTETAILLKYQPANNQVSPRNFLYFQCCKEYLEIYENNHDCILCRQANHCCPQMATTQDWKQCKFHDFWK